MSPVSDLRTAERMRRGRPSRSPRVTVQPWPAPVRWRQRRGLDGLTRAQRECLSGDVGARP